METVPDSQGSEQIIQPDRRLVAGAWVLLALAIAVIWLANDYLVPIAAEWLKRSNVSAPAHTAERTAAVTLAMLCVPAALCLIYAFWAGLMALRIFRSGVFPPKGYPVLIKTRVLHGPAARREGIKFIVFGIAALCLLGYMFWSLWSIAPVAEALRARFTF